MISSLKKKFLPCHYGYKILNFNNSRVVKEQLNNMKNTHDFILTINVDKKFGTYIPNLDIHIPQLDTYVHPPKTHGKDCIPVTFELYDEYNYVTFKDNNGIEYKIYFKVMTNRDEIGKYSLFYKEKPKSNNVDAPQIDEKQIDEKQSGGRRSKKTKKTKRTKKLKSKGRRVAMKSRRRK